MSGGKRGRSRTVFFCYADPAGFSGQKAAMEIVMAGLAQRGWVTRKLPLPVLDRRGRKGRSYLAFGLQLITSWCGTLRMGGQRGAWAYIAVGQTRISFVRDLVPAIVARIFLGRDRIIFPLHSSLFMTWTSDSSSMSLFRLLLRQAGWITTLGEGQRSRLLAMGFKPERVRVLANTCSLDPLDDVQLEAKLADQRDRPARLLYLSSLVDTKGYPEYLEALESLSLRPGVAFEAVLCGPLDASAFSARFPKSAGAESWIEGRVGAINQAARCRVQWIRGARGPAKDELFRHADIFVLPTYYAVEAQPIVLLEAMAAGCAIVTSMPGEISTILDSDTAFVVSDPLGASVTGAIAWLITHPDARATFARAANERYRLRFGRDRHVDAWEALLTKREGAGPGQ